MRSNQIKQQVDTEIRSLARRLDAIPFSPLPRPYRKTIAEFISRDGKRIRPILFVTGYRGCTARRPKGIYTAAVSLELLHDFILVHDDLIDHAAVRRGRPAMHVELERELRRQGTRRFSGKDLAIVVGDMLYALALDSLMAVQEAPQRKQEALAILTRTALHTGCGEMDELLHTLKPLSAVTKADIYRIYDGKTSHYSFACPLAMGATLAGADKKTVAGFVELGLLMGRAFQIKDDVIDLMDGESGSGKPGLIDLQEGKRTLPVWLAYRNASARDKRVIEKALNNGNGSLRARRDAARTIERCGGIADARRESRRLLKCADGIMQNLPMRSPYGALLRGYADELLDF